MIRVENLSYTYPGKDAPSLKNINLSIDKGEFVLITGATGCGKSTLLKCLSGIIPHATEGIMTGKVFIDGALTENESLSVLSQKAGLVHQNPDDQIFSLVVEDEVAFGPENLCLLPEEIEVRVSSSLNQVGMSDFRSRNVNTLSGGQKQRVAIAAILSMSPSVILLDEPASQLDPKGAEDILSVVTQLKDSHGKTIVLVEHRVHEVFHLADRIIVMEKGEVIVDGTRDEIAACHMDIFEALGIRIPESIELCRNLQIEACPLSQKETVRCLKKKINGAKIPPSLHISNKNQNRIKALPVAKISDLWFAYEKENWILEGIDFELRKGDMVALMGNNGSGKSTLLLHMCGLLIPKKGYAEVLGKNTRYLKKLPYSGEVGVVFQDPGLMLFCDTVWKETAFGPENIGIGKVEKKTRVRDALSAMAITDLSREPPQALSGGQRLRAAVASVLSMKPGILLFDEPTSGQDKKNIINFMSHIKSLTESGITALFITHDMETALTYADRLMIMDKGRLVLNEDVSRLSEKPHMLEKMNIKLPMAYSLGNRLGFSPSFCAADLAEKIKTVMAHA